MNSKKVFFLIAVFLPFFIKAQDKPEYSFLKISEELLKNADEVIRHASGTYTVLSDKEGVMRYKYAVTVNNEKSDAEHLTFVYNKERKLSNISIRIYDAFGNLVRKVKKSELTDHSAFDGYSVFQDVRYKYLNATYQTFPYTIEYTYEQSITGMHFAFFPDWHVIPGANTSVEKSTFTVKLPKGKRFHYKVLNSEEQVNKTDEGKFDVYSWEFLDQPAIIAEPNMPHISKISPWVMTAADEFKIDKYEGGMGSWEAYSAFIKKLFEGRAELSSDLIEEINTLIAKAENDEEKIKILYRFMQKNMRYVSVQLGLGGWQPFDAEYVYRNKYGDCKALTNYMYAMLKQVGIESYPALIYSGEVPYEALEDFVNSPFNHVVLYIPSEDYWLECTSTNYPANYIGSHNANRKALLIQKEGGHLIKTPELGFEENIQTSKTVIHFKADGSAKIKSEINTKGIRHEGYRFIENQYSEKETKEWLEGYTLIPSVSFKGHKISSGKDTPQSKFIYEAESRRFGSKAGKRMFLPVNVINRYGAIPPKKEKRIHPLVLSEGYIETDTIQIHLPGGYEIESIPGDGVSLENDYARYNLRFEKQDNLLKVVRRLEVHRAELPPEQYEDYRNFFKKVAKSDGIKVVLVMK